MRYRIWFTLAAIAVVASDCGGGSPIAPAPAAASASSASSLQGATVSAIDGRPLAGITVKIDSQSAVSDATGTFQLDNLAPGNRPEILTAASVVERHTTAVMPAAGPTREALIPADFDLGAFDEMFRGSGRIERWTSAPSLVVMTTVMNYESGLGGDNGAYHATSEQLTDAETDLLVAQLTDGLALLTADTFAAFASVERESASSGSTVNTLRTGKIVVGRYKGIQGLLNTIGFGRWATDANGQVIGGSMYLDRDFDKTSDRRRLLRTHELGHALGYNHVTTRTSIMNPAIGPEATSFDRQGSAIAFQRIPGNESPDNDPSGSPAPRSGGGVFGIAPVSPTWHLPVVP